MKIVGRGYGVEDKGVRVMGGLSSYGDGGNGGK